MWSIVALSFMVMMFGCWFIPVGLFWYGWSTQEKIHWIVPIIGTGWIGVGVVVSFVSPLVMVNTLHQRDYIETDQGWHPRLPFRLT